MKELIEAVWKLPRDLVSDGFDAALGLLGQGHDMAVHAFPSGSPCWSWTIPDKWTCHQAFIERTNGDRILSYEDCPLHVASYSVPVDRIMSRKELMRHLHTHPVLPNAIPYLYGFYNRDWGFGCTQETFDSLSDAEYRVRIDSSFEPGSLKVGEVVVHGRSKKSVMLCAHIDHPYQVNDGLIGAVVGLDIMRRLREGPRPEYTYRLLLVSETIGSVAYLSSHEHAIPDMVGGLFLEMLGLDRSLFLQHSYNPESLFDRICVETLRTVEPDFRSGPFLRVVANDERQFNGIGARVPMVSLSRVHAPFLEGDLFPEYHSHLDDPSRVNQDRLEQARDAVLEIIHRWERTPVPYPNYKGEPFLTGYGVTYDFANEQDLSQAIVESLYEFDGTRSLDEIARKIRCPVEQVDQIAHEFHEKGLIELVGGSTRNEIA